MKILPSGKYPLYGSPVHEAPLHKIQKVTEGLVLYLKMGIHTRWLSHDQAVTFIRCTLPLPLTTLENELAENDNTVAHGLLHAFKSYKFVATIYLLNDVLPLLSKLILIIYKEKIDLCVVKPVVNVTLASLKVLIISDKPGADRKQLG